MRKRLLALVLMLIAAISTFAYYFKSDGIYFNILSMEEHTCEVTYGSTNCDSYSGDIIIPSVVQYGGNEYTVVGIGECAFRESPFRKEGSVTSVSIPSSVTTIGDSAFSGCTGLTSLSSIPSSVTTIGKYAFSYCTGLTSLRDLPSSITTIEDGTFLVAQV